MKPIPEGRRSPPAGALGSGSPTPQHRDSNPGGAAPGRVVHCKREPFDVYIGRPSKWGNPFVVGKDGTREEVVAKYRRWLETERQDLMWSAPKELRGKVLGCWCAPKSCHGDVLLRLANQ